MIPLDQLGSVSDDGLRRDQWGRLLVVGPDDDEPRGYTRVTTVAKTTDEGGGLMPWKATMTACGLMRRPGLRAQWEALIAAHDGDPWYASEDAKAACKRLVEETAAAGGATDRREIGLALHAITAQLDRRDELRYLTPETERDLTAYTNTLIERGITIVPDMIEVTVVLDRYGVGGTFDRLVTVPGYELPLIADLKTGADLSYSWGSFAVQLSAYAHADAIYAQGADPNGSEDMRLTMPEVDRTSGLIIWLPAGEGRCELFVVDLDLGWSGFNLAHAMREWRREKALVGPLSVWAPTPAQPSAPVVASPAPRALTLLPEPAAEPEPDRRPDVRAWLQARIDTIGRYSELARADLIRTWPPGLPTLGAASDHNDAQLAVIEHLLDDVEARHSVPFGPTKPGTALPTTPEEATARLLRTFPNSTLTPKDEPPT